MIMAAEVDIIQLCVKSLQEMIKAGKFEVDFIQFRSLISTIRHFKRGNAFMQFDEYSELLKLLIEISANGLLSTEAGTLLSTVLCYLVRNTLSLDERCHLLGECILAKNILTIKLRNYSTFICSVIIKNIEQFKLCLSYSILESFDVESLPNFYAPNFCAGESSNSPFLLIFDYLENTCMKLSKLICISFKLLILWLVRFKDLFRLKYIELKLLEFYFKKVMFIVSSNWENPVSGIREKNMEVLKHIFDIFPQSNHPQNGMLNLSYFLETTILHLPWRMKCKYFILAALLSKFGFKKAFREFPSILDGLFYSLSCSHLASAGMNLYRNILKEIQMKDWLYFFLFPIKRLLFGTDSVAKQNLMSHWMPETLKTYPSVIDILLTDLSRDMDSSPLLPKLVLLKIGRRRGILKWEQIDEKLISLCLSHLNEEVRGEAFSITCMGTKMFPSQTEFNMVCRFLEENINSDSTKIRQAMLCSFKIFISRLRDSYINVAEYGLAPSDASTGDFKSPVDFILWLNKFIIVNNVPGANYQRRITSLYLLRIIFTEFYLKMVEPESLGCNSQDASFVKVIEIFFKSNDVFSILLRCLTDPALDIRDTASFILKTNFKPPSEEIFLLLWEKTLSKCVSSVFYETDSGGALAEVLVHWSLCKPCIAIGEKNFSFFEVFLSHAEQQRVKLEENLLKGALEGPVHGVLSALHRLISNPAVLMSFRLKQIHIQRMLELIDGLTTFLIGVLSSKAFAVTDGAPSFAEMGEAIECIILQNADGLDDVDVEELSSANELVLNCVWLNLKMCCLLASALAVNVYGNEGIPNALFEEDVKRCAQLLMCVLLKCRHKGVIESAGNALSSVALFCSKNTNFKVQEIPRKLLNDSLEMIVEKETNLERTSITRSSAGLAVLVHRLFATDFKNNASVFFPKLLSWTEINDPDVADCIETEDLLQTRALHLLKVIVQDSASFQYLSPYMSDIALACFKSFRSTIWAVRNAALQLFGVVSSKLIGQKKMQEEDIVGTNLTVEELNAHYPDLVDFILKELKKSENVTYGVDAALPTLLPILALCSRLSIGLPHLHSNLFSKLLSEFQSVFLNLLSSPIIAVRTAAAKAMSGFTSLTQLHEQTLFLIDSLRDDLPSGGNTLHGKLLCIKMLRDKLQLDSYSIPEFASKFKELNNHIKKINIENSFENIPMYVRAIFYELQNLTDKEVSDIVKTVSSPIYTWYPGTALWSTVSVDLIMLSCPESSICHIIKQCSKCNYTVLESSIVSLMKRTDLYNLSDSVKVDTIQLLINLCDSSLPLNITKYCLHSILQLGTVSTASFSKVKLQFLFAKFIQNSSYGMYCSATALPLVSCFIMRNTKLSRPRDLLVEIASAIIERSSPKYSEVYRLEAANALMYLIPMFNQKYDSKENSNILICLLDSAILLIQDENSEVRMQAAKFVSNLNMPEGFQCPQTIFSPQSCLKTIFSKIFNLLPFKTALEFLWGKLICRCSVNRLKNYKKIIRNPFDHGEGNIYAENIITTTMAAEILLNIVKTDLYELRDFINLLYKNKTRIIMEATAITQHVLSHVFDEFQARVEAYHILIKIKYQLEIILAARIEGFQKLEDIISDLDMGLTKIRSLVTITGKSLD